MAEGHPVADTYSTDAWHERVIYGTLSHGWVVGPLSQFVWQWRVFSGSNLLTGQSPSERHARQMARHTLGQLEEQARSPGAFD